MSNTSTEFRMARRGYEPAQVDERIRELTQAVEVARRQSVELARRVEELESHQQSSGESSEPTFADLGARIGQILTMAQEEAVELRASGTADAEQCRKEAEGMAVKVRDEADRYAEEKRFQAEAEFEEVIAGAKQKAAEIREQAKRDAASRKGEAEAIFEKQRAKAAKAAAEFETNLAQRRERAEQSLAERTQAAEAHLVSVQERAERTRADAEQIYEEATGKSERLVEDAQRKAREMVTEATGRAERLRAESERELAAVAQRRDSINAQLANVRQMLSTLLGGQSSDLFDQLPAVDDDDPSDAISAKKESARASSSS